MYMKPILKKVKEHKDKYLIITDLDGTFLSTGSNMTHHIMNNVAVKKVIDLGHEFVIASGRSPQLIKPIYDHLELTTPIIAFHGAMILDPRNLHPNLKLEDKPVPISVIKEIINETEIFDNTFLVEIVGYKKSNSITNKNDIDYIDYDPYEVVFATKRDMYDENQIVNLLESKWKDKIKVKFMPGGSGLNYDMILIVAPNVDKVNAIITLSNYYNIPKENIIYFGDNYNDLKAIEYVKNGVAMVSGKKRVIDNAKYVTNFSNNEGGVGDFLLRLMEK